MNTTSTLRTGLLAPVFLLFLSSGLAQGWEYSFPTTDFNDLSNPPAGQNLPLSDGSALVFNFFSQNSADLIKIGADGNPVAIDDTIVAQYATAKQKLYDLGGGDALLAGAWQDGTMFHVRLDTAMHFWWQGTYKTGVGHYKNDMDFGRTADGGWLAALFSFDSLYLLRLGPAMDTIWRKTIYVPLPLGNYIDPVSVTSVVRRNDGGFLLCANTTAYLWPNYINLGGKVVWIDSTGNVEQVKTGLGTLGTIWPTAGGFLHVRSDFKVEKWSPAGDLLQTVDIASLAVGLNANYVITGFTPLSDGNWAVCGHTTAAWYQYRDVFLAKITPSGALLWVKKYGSYFWPEKGGRLAEMPDQGLLIQGFRSVGKVYLIRTDSLGNSLTNQVFGRVFLDENNNCKPDSGEAGLAGYKIRLTNDLDYYEASDSAGLFFFQLGNGTHPLRINRPEPYWKFCSDSLSVAFSGSQQDSIYFALQKVVDCPLMHVDAGAGRLRRCFSNTLSIYYRNDGTVTADSVTIRVQLDSFLIFENASLPVSGQQGNVYEFAAGAVEPGAQLVLKIQCKVSCDAPLGYLHCLNAHIYPDSLCLADSLFHFGDDWPMDDEICIRNQGSFDPNDKSAWPEGAGNQQLVSRDSTIHYLIRFQNTGTDTAFNVVVLDELSPWLDPLTLRPGASSHPYTWEIGGEGVLKFTFSNIQLPDSFANKPASHGFVRFSIKPKPFTPVWTQISNQAGIYFDFNAPIITNTVQRTIDRLWETSIIEKAICEGKNYSGIWLTADTVLVDTLILSDTYVLQKTVINVLDSVRVEYDSVVPPGTVVYGTYIYSDKTVTKKFLMSNGCDSTVIVHCFLIVGTEEGRPGAPAIQVYPNPALDFLLVRVFSEPGAGFKLQLFDLAGRLMLSEINLMGHPQGQTHRLNLRGWPAGVYRLELSGTAGTAVRKFIKMDE